MRMIMMPRRHHGCVSFWPQTGELRKLSRSRRLIPGHGCVSFCPRPVRAHQPERLLQPVRPRAQQPGLHQPVLPQARQPGLYPFPSRAQRPLLLRAHQPEQLQQPMRPRALQPGMHQPVLPQAQRPGLSVKSVWGLGWHLWTEEREGKTETRAGVEMGTAREATSR